MPLHFFFWHHFYSVLQTPWDSWDVPFWTDVSMKLLLERKVHSWLETMLKKFLASTLSGEMMRNWKIRLKFSSLGIQFPSANLHCSGILPLLQMTNRIFYSCSKRLGQLSDTTCPWSGIWSRSSNCTSGLGGMISILHSPKSFPFSLKECLNDLTFCRMLWILTFLGFLK